MEFSETSKDVGPLLARQQYMMAKEYDNVVNFTIGGPAFPRKLPSVRLHVMQL